MKFIKLEFTPLEFETNQQRTEFKSFSHQNLLRWSLKHSCRRFGGRQACNQNLLRWSLKPLWDVHKFVVDPDQNLLRWSLKQYDKGLSLKFSTLEFTPLEFETV